MKKAFLTIVLICLVCVGYGQLQVRFIKGTITTIDNTTIEAFVRSISLSSLDSKVAYKNDLNQKEFESLPASVIESIVLENGEEYKRVNYSESDTHTAHTTLSRVLVKGDLTLFQANVAQITFFLLQAPNMTYVLREDKIVGTSLKHYFFKNLMAAATNDKPELYTRVEHLKFSEKDFVTIVNDYNMLKSGSSTVIKPTYQQERFLMAFVNYAPVTDAPNLLIQANARFYNLKFSHSLSLNIGFHYLNYQYDLKGNFTLSGTKTVNHVRFTGNFFSIPIYAQENLLNGKFRPFIFGGMNLSYYHETDEYNRYHQEQGFQKTYGINYLIGGGIEWSVAPNIILKGMWIHEHFNQPLLAGIGYCISR